MRIRPGITAAATSHDLVQTSIWNVLRQRFYALAVDAGAVASTEGWTDIGADKIVEAVGILLSDGWTVSTSDNDGRRVWFATRGPDAVFVDTDDDGAWTVTVAGSDAEVVSTVLGRVAAAFPAPDLTDASAVAVRFWAMGAMGPFSYQRRIDVTPWAEARQNYPSEISDDLDELLAMGPPSAGGRLLLFHGVPGTGKTHLIRSLTHAWSDWCDVDYIVDADEFFGQAAYMVSALVMGSDGDKWRLVVIEDAGEFLVSNARERIGQGLSRLLNLSDGLVGQGLKLLVLMTTNEDASELHPAVTRPGRCMFNIGFVPFPTVEAQEWMRSHVKTPDNELASDLIDAPMTLAEMYAEV